jgi:hypothetical protein
LLSKNIKIKTYSIAILPIVSYGCETWSLRVRQEQRLRVSEYRVLRGIGGQVGETTGDWRKLHNEGLHDVYCSANIIRVMKSRRVK